MEFLLPGGEKIIIGILCQIIVKPALQVGRHIDLIGNHTHVVEKIESEVAILLQECEVKGFSAQFNIAKNEAIPDYTVSQYTPESTGSAETFA